MPVIKIGKDGRGAKSNLKQYTETKNDKKNDGSGGHIFFKFIFHHRTSHLQNIGLPPALLLVSEHFHL